MNKKEEMNKEEMTELATALQSDRSLDSGLSTTAEKPT